jgi:hypothetical protein
MALPGFFHAVIFFELLCVKYEQQNNAKPVGIGKIWPSKCAKRNFV